ncbi:response regulator transcription factor NblR [Leptolyngbya sp. FACHB-261]|uniref:response regulator transcription factor NblR n=1 Tax=Leptolyngbya sp. FACHB-261 TaxID=2692806 RepID=UPI00168686EF|nr:response regulator transcription factor [Leptolyngbya sp. FACHB-261]MBD2105068.1 response regulator transcription factor [Leptolyngbya sp. FACHB-261]
MSTDVAAQSPSPQTAPRVLIVEADVPLAEHLSLDLCEAGYEATIAHDAPAGLQQAQRLQPDLVVVDRFLGGESGLWLCRHLRALGLQIPLLLLMGRDEVDDRVACLESGADDYILKPYRSDEFLKLVRLYLRSTHHPTPPHQLRFQDLLLDSVSHEASRGGRSIELTAKEFELLRYLMEHPREVLTREQILENVWGYDFMGESNVIEVYIRYLRLKIEEEGEKRLIQTVRGVGYVLRES